MVVEGALEGELDDHLGYSRNDPVGRNGGNSRNGHRAETVPQQGEGLGLTTVADGGLGLGAAPPVVEAVGTWPSHSVALKGLLPARARSARAPWNWSSWRNRCADGS